MTRQIRTGIQAIAYLALSISIAHGFEFSKDTVYEYGFHGDSLDDTVTVVNESSMDFTFDSVYVDTILGNNSALFEQFYPFFVVRFHIQTDDTRCYVFPGQESYGTQWCDSISISGQSALLYRFEIYNYNWPAAIHKARTDSIDTLRTRIVFVDGVLRDTLLFIGRDAYHGSGNVHRPRYIAPRHRIRPGGGAYTVSGQRMPAGCESGPTSGVYMDVARLRFIVKGCARCQRWRE
ncbi:MAG: hypothetical protein GF418_12385 [Chitinivibrionales bacterium]|nr:hypothetical protein [Chitinivibrionales bacterium]MBD3396417.1 hypothetical protein [Chitinivibrionales bacterium]